MKTERCAATAARALRTCAWMLVCAAPLAAAAEAPPAAPDEVAAPDEAAVPDEPILCACRSIEEIDPLDAVVQRGHGARARA